MPISRNGCASITSKPRRVRCRREWPDNAQPALLFPLGAARMTDRLARLAGSATTKPRTLASHGNR